MVVRKQWSLPAKHSQCPDSNRTRQSSGMLKIKNLAVFGWQRPFVSERPFDSTSSLHLPCVVAAFGKATKSRFLEGGRRAKSPGKPVYVEAGEQGATPQVNIRG